jgi:Capsular polysaccharide synthesis protein.
MNLNVTNKLIKKTRRWHKKTGFSLFQRAARHFEQKKKETIFSVIDDLKLQSDVVGTAESVQSRIIWICWFQGLEGAPELVKRCIESVYKLSGSLKTVIITDNNFSDYLSLPPNIINKYKSGLIGKAHFSDILRCCLLHKYGGIWLDATIFLTRELSSSFFRTSFCSLRFKYNENYGSISNGLWTTYLLASEKNGYLIGRVMDGLIKYWGKYDVAIDYFLMDYIFRYFFENDEIAQKYILAQPVLGKNRFLLKSNMNNSCSVELLEQLSQDKTGIYKLTYKEKYRTSDNGQPTVYSQILDGSFHPE